MRDRLLIRHFLWRFVEHDLISPNVDRHGVLAITGGVIIAVTLFPAVIIAWGYQLQNVMPPGIASIKAMDDRFLFVSAAMLIAALAAVAQWDGLVLDVRDTAVLGPLPIPKAVIVRTKFAATALFGLAFILAAIVSPTLLRLAAIPIGLPVGMPGALWLTFAHGIATFAAGAFGFLGVLALRESAVALLGADRFRRISPIMQGVLLVVILTALLLVPAQGHDVARRWLASDSPVVRVVPMFWFVGLHESIAGAVFDNLPRRMPSERRLVIPEQLSTTLYRELWPRYHELATAAVIALAVVAVAATLACFWNNRRLPMTAGVTDRSAGITGRGLRWLAVHGLAPTALQQAGFFFALQTLSRRGSHRIPMAAALAVGLSLVVTALGIGPAAGARDVMPPSLFIAQSFLIGSVLTGFRHAMRLPAELRASSSFCLAWTGQVAPYVTGVKRAGWTAVVLPSLLLLAVWHAAIAGPRFAVMHGIVGVALSAILMNALFLYTTRVPLASAHVPEVDAKSHAIIYSVALLFVSTFLAAVERWSFGAPERYAAFVAGLLAVAAALAVLGRDTTQAVVPLTIDEAAPLPTQRLNLAG